MQNGATLNPSAVAGGRNRLDSIDLLRGLVIVIMALDHVKGNFTNAHFDMTDLTKTTPIYFFTRWITHYCAPTFVFLAGAGAFLYGSRGRSKRTLAWFLLSRGAWLILLELTVIRFSWFLNWDYQFSFGQVIWAIGWSMIVLAGLIFLPLSAITTIGVGMIVLHNHFDSIAAADWGAASWLWKILHTGEMITWPKGTVVHPLSTLVPWSVELPHDFTFHPFYPLIPWIGVLAAGYGFGALYLLPPERRRRELFGLGLTLTLLFVGLRLTNLYGDKVPTPFSMVAEPQPSGTLPGPWARQDTWLFTLMSFINTQKYPPSLLFLLMTLGPAITALALFERDAGPIGRFFIVYGRVPLFFYLLHWYLIKALVLGFMYLKFHEIPDRPPEDHGYDLWVVYLLWIGVVVALYPLCYWFAGVKRRSKAAWLSYL